MKLYTLLGRTLSLETKEFEKRLLRRVERRSDRRHIKRRRQLIRLGMVLLVVCLALLTVVAALSVMWLVG